MRKLKRALAAAAFVAFSLPVLASSYGHLTTVHYSYKAGEWCVNVCITFRDYNCNGRLDGGRELSSVTQIRTSMSRWGGYNGQPN